jgi:hypothetical protein
VSAWEASGVNLRGPCPNCGTALSTDQRYCAECGERLVAPLSMPYAAPPLGANRFGLPMPLRVASTLALATLVFGVVVGTAMSTALSEQVEPPPPMVAQAAPPEPPKPKPAAAPPVPAPTTPPPVASSVGSSYAPGLDPEGTSGGAATKPRPQILSGTVVHTNRAAGSYSLAQGGPLVAIHARSLPEPGARVRTPVRQLINGTYAEDGKRKTRSPVGRATFSGTVTFRPDQQSQTQQGQHFYSVSGTGTSVLVHVRPDAAGNASLPEFASQVTVTVSFDSPSATPPPTTPPTGTTTTPQPTANACDTDGEAVAAGQTTDPTVQLNQVDRKVDQSAVTSSSLAGIVQAVCPGTSQLVLSADDVRASDQDSVLSVASGIDLRKVHVGRPITATVTLKPPDLLSLGSLAGDQGVKGADSQKQVQGSSG